MKQTEIDGVADTLIPDDWEVKSLGEVATIVGGGTPSTLNSAYWNGDIQWFTPAELSDSKKYVSKSERTITERGLKESSAKLLPKGTVLLTTRASIGITAILENPASTNQGFQSLIAKNNCCSEFLYYVIPLIKDEMLSRASGSTFAEISAKKLSTITFQLPPLPEQQRIAKALSDVDALISTTEKPIQKKKNIKQGAMQNLLTGKKRLPGFGDKQTDLFVPNGTHTKEVKDVSPEQIRLSAKMKQTELGEIPEDWEVKNINKECIIKARIGWQGLKSTEYLDSGDYILITGTDFDSGFINWKSCSYVTKWRFDQDKNIQIKQGDVLITKDGTIGKVAFLNEIPMQGTLNSGVFVIRPKNPDKMDSVFLSLIFKSFWFDAFLEQITSGSTIVHLYQKDFVKFNFPLPSKEEQTAIANVLSSMDKEIETLNTKLEKYRNLKTAMMQQLLMGKIRL